MNDVSIAGFPHIYLQGPGALERLPGCIEDIAPGGCVAIVADPIVAARPRCCRSAASAPAARSAA